MIMLLLFCRDRDSWLINRHSVILLCTPTSFHMHTTVNNKQLFFDCCMHSLHVKTIRALTLLLLVCSDIHLYIICIYAFS